MTQVFRYIGSLRMAIVASLLAITMTLGVMQPVVSAESAGARSTRNIILGALAVTGIVLYSNYQRHAAYARSVVGYTRDGGVVYGDGRIVYPDGTVVYASNNGSTPCTFDGYGRQCSSSNVYGYYPRGYNSDNPYVYNQTQYYRSYCGNRGHDRGKHQGWCKHHRGDGNNQGDNHGGD